MIIMIMIIMIMINIIMIMINIIMIMIILAPGSRLGPGPRAALGAAALDLG